jgi:hypothetical protein
LVDEIVAALGADFLREGASAIKAAVTNSAAHKDSMPAANINPE